MILKSTYYHQFYYTFIIFDKILIIKLFFSLIISLKFWADGSCLGQDLKCLKVSWLTFLSSTWCFNTMLIFWLLVLTIRVSNLWHSFANFISLTAIRLSLRNAKYKNRESHLIKRRFKRSSQRKLLLATLTRQCFPSCH